MATVTINDTTSIFDVYHFGYDGCHKIYLVTNKEGQDQLLNNDYELTPIEELPKVWGKSCGLRFISSADLKINFVNQCSNNVKIKVLAQ